MDMKKNDSVFDFRKPVKFVITYTPQTTNVSELSNRIFSIENSNAKSVEGIFIQKTSFIEAIEKVYNFLK